jgi:hypothetical protein
MTGSLVVGGTMYLFKGCYVTMILKSPLQSLVGVYHHRKHLREDCKDGLALPNSSLLMHGSRALCTSLIEFSFGVDIMMILSEDVSWN